MSQSGDDNMDFIVKGSFKAGMNWEHFTKEISGETKNSALKNVYSILGSKHRAKKNFIKITSIEEVKK